MTVLTGPSPGTYPVRVDAGFDPAVSRWLWLVKWLLVLPHVLVLAVLWPVFFVLSLVAFFAILITGRYPRPLFDVDVGILRWSWRVAYYCYAANGTDRYPPFTFADVPDYPAHLEVPYPEHLSRGLVLVKWWLLALPHYLVVGLLTGSGTYVVWQTDTGDWATRSSGPGLIGLLVLVAVVVLLFRGRYPRGIFDLVLGLDRWVLRVAAYAGLLTDAYPPFRLDSGGRDPGTLQLTTPDAPPPPVPTAGPAPAAEPTPPAAPGAPGEGHRPEPPAAPKSSTGRVVAIVLGALAALLGLALTAGAALLLAVDTHRDADGYLTTGTASFASSTPALVSEPLEVSLRDVPGGSDVLGEIRLHVTSTTGEPVFVGVGDESAVRQWLAGTAYDEVRSITQRPFGGQTTRVGGVVTRVPTPVAQTFWVARATGVRDVTASWRVQRGTWVVVVASASGSPGVGVQARAAADVPDLGWIGGGVLAAGLVLLLVGATVVVVAALRRPAGPPR
jgi:hypothetical protein